MDIKSKNGVKFTDAMFDELAAAYESGKWPGRATGEIVMGRPRLADEDAKTVTFKLPVSKIAALDKFANDHDKTRSETLRQAVDELLLQA
jgi:hypothetical protein